MEKNFNLRCAIWKSGLKDYEISLRSSVPPSKLSLIVNGRLNPTQAIKMKLAKLLNQKVEELFPEEVKK